MDEKNRYRARRGGREFALTPEDAGKMPPAELAETEVEIDGQWVRPWRFVSTGEDFVPVEE